MPVQVLIVDDQEPFQRAAHAVVDATDGFGTVGVVATGEAAVEAADALRPDLVLMDVNLPGIDGLEATRRILGVNRLNRIVVLLLSAYEEEEHAANAIAIACGAAGYVPKSAFRPERLAAAWAAATAD
jgi:DNA-binding NarL/FixJ family response regulator